jgi:hypothetical protein
MNQKDMVAKCKERGFDVTSPLIYRQGKIHGFLIRNGKDGRERYDVDEKKFYEWLDNLKVSDDYLPVGETARKHNIPYSGLKYQLRKENCEMKKMGIVKGGLLYAKRTDIERAVAQYSRRTKK